jgi:hypothetical protein
MLKLSVRNTITNEIHYVADFKAQGDLLIAMNALQSVAPKHLIYFQK